MAVILISTPEPIVSPTLNSKWLATESENIFRLQRKDFAVTGQSDGGSPTVTILTLSIPYTGTIGNDIAIHDTYNNAIYTGKVIDIDGSDVYTDIPYVATMSIDYLNDDTLHGGYYFEGRLTINNIVQSLTVIASPDSYGFADLDISGILRIMTSMGKTGDYSALLMKEPTKSGKFTLEYRECWYGSNESYTAEDNTWYYAEAVRSEEQGSNLYDYVATSDRDAPFLNSFEQPVYFLGLPFDLSFILPEEADSSVDVVIRVYNSSNVLLDTITSMIDATNLKGYINSLNIDPTSIPEGTDHMEIEIELTPAA
jgi:hypothetical protein